MYEGTCASNCDTYRRASSARTNARVPLSERGTRKSKRLARKTFLAFATFLAIVSMSGESPIAPDSARQKSGSRVNRRSDEGLEPKKHNSANCAEIFSAKSSWPCRMEKVERVQPRQDIP